MKISKEKTMADKFLLDTNAYFNFLKFSSVSPPGEKTLEVFEAIKIIKNGTCYISALSLIEIISVIGKYARGSVGGYEKCQCIISDTGDRCEHYRYSKTIKRMKPKAIKQWIRLVNDTVSGNSPLLSLTILPFSEKTITEAKKIIEHSLIHSFGSLDAMIAATAKECAADTEMKNIVLVTSDKGLKSCLNKCEIAHWDAFKNT